MSTWISKSVLLAAAGWLAACDGGIDVGQGLGLGLGPSRPAPSMMAVAGERVVVAGPPGYCVDPSASHDGIKAFVLLASCASISGDRRAPVPGVPGVLTVTVSSDPQSYVDVGAAREALAAFFGTEAGRAMLSRAGRSEDVTVNDIRAQNGVLYIHAIDTGPGAPAGTVPGYWRALFNVNGRLVTVTVMGSERRPMSTAAGLSVLETVTTRIRRQSAALG